MIHPKTDETRVIRATSDVDYLSAGVDYLATPDRGGRTWRFDRLDETSGTFLAAWQVKRAVGDGSLEILEGMDI